MANRQFRIRPVGHSSWVVEVKKWYGWRSLFHNYCYDHRSRKTFSSFDDAYDALIKDIKYDIKTKDHLSKPSKYYTEYGLLVVNELKENPF